MLRWKSGLAFQGPSFPFWWFFSDCTEMKLNWGQDNKRGGGKTGISFSGLLHLPFSFPAPHSISSKPPTSWARVLAPPPASYRTAPLWVSNELFKNRYNWNFFFFFVNIIIFLVLFLWHKMMLQMHFLKFIYLFYLLFF